MRRAVMVGLLASALLLGAAYLGVLHWYPTIPTEAEQRKAELLAWHQIGSAKAHGDIRNGMLALMSAGLPAPWSDEYWQILQSRYKVENRFGVGCIGNAEEFALIESYNRVMAA